MWFAYSEVRPVTTELELTAEAGAGFYTGKRWVGSPPCQSESGSAFSGSVPLAIQHRQLRAIRQAVRGSREQGGTAAEAMIADLVKGQEAAIKAACKVFLLAENANDQPTADLLTQRMNIHEKTAWMLRSMLE